MAAAPIWRAATRDVSAATGAELALWALLSAWAWSGIAGALARYRWVGLVAVVLATAPAFTIGEPTGPTSDLVRYLSAVSGPALYVADASYRGLHPVLLCGVGAVAWVYLGRNGAVGRSKLPAGCDSDAVGLAGTEIETQQERG